MLRKVIQLSPGRVALAASRIRPHVRCQAACDSVDEKSRLSIFLPPVPSVGSCSVRRAEDRRALSTSAEHDGWDG